MKHDKVFLETVDRALTGALAVLLVVTAICISRPWYVTTIDYYNVRPTE